MVEVYDYDTETGLCETERNIPFYLNGSGFFFWRNHQIFFNGNNSKTEKILDSEKILNVNIESDYYHLQKFFSEKITNVEEETFKNPIWFNIQTFEKV